MRARTFTVSLVSTLILAGTALSAADYEVLMLDDGFFPKIVHVQPGDTVTFTNVTGSVESIAATDGTWSTADLGPDNSASVLITADATGMTYSFDADSSDPKVGNFSFDPAPLE